MRRLPLSKYGKRTKKAYSTDQASLEQIVLSDTKSKSWQKNYKYSFEENIVEDVTSQFGLQQVIF